MAILIAGRESSGTYAALEAAHVEHALLGLHDQVVAVQEQVALGTVGQLGRLRLGVGRTEGICFEVVMAAVGLVALDEARFGQAALALGTFEARLVPLHVRQDFEDVLVFDREQAALAAALLGGQLDWHLWHCGFCVCVFFVCLVCVFFLFAFV